MAITREQYTPRTGSKGAGGSFAPRTTSRGAGGAIPQPKTPPRPASSSVRQIPAQVGRTAPSGGGGGGGSLAPYSLGGSIGGVGTFAAPAAPTPPPSEEDYLAGDAGFQASLASLLKALQMFESDDTAQRTKYETDYKDGIRQLGWTPDNAETADVDESNWNWEDQNTASGRAYQSQLGDFAGRGMLQSSGYARAANDLRRSFNDQLGSVNRARADFLSQRDRDLAAYREENKSAQGQSRAEALARRAAQYAL